MTRVADLVWWVPALAFMGIIAWFSHQPTWPDAALGYPDWLLHGGAYVCLAVLCQLGAGRGQLPPGWRASWLAAGVALAYGALDELHQSTVPGRVAAVDDWVADAVGVGIATAWALVWRRLGEPSPGVGRSE